MRYRFRALRLWVDARNSSIRPDSARAPIGAGIPVESPERWDARQAGHLDHRAAALVNRQRSPSHKLRRRAKAPVQSPFSEGAKIKRSKVSLTFQN